MLLVPWLVSNLSRYGALTAIDLVREQQGGFLNPTGEPFDLTNPGRLLDVDVALLNGLVPEEWYASVFGQGFFVDPQEGPRPLLRALLRTLLVLLVLVPIGLWLTRRPRDTWLLVAMLPLGLALTQVQTLALDFPFVQPRYVYFALPAFGLAAGLALTSVVPHRVAAFAAGGITTVLAGLWIYLTTVPPTPGA